MFVYFDNAASTQPLKSVAEKMTSVMLDFYANPSSMSVLGLESAQILVQAQKTLAEWIHAVPDEIYFTSGGTEGNNWAIRGTAEGYHRNGRHMITTKMEHPAVLEPFKRLEQEGWEISYLDIDEAGQISLTALKEAIRPETVLVSILFCNNETGSIAPVTEIGYAIKEKNKSTLFHVDAVQAFGKMKIDVKKSMIDLLTVSGHKFHGPKGTGFLYMKKGLKVTPLLLGGGQQRAMRSGTENPAVAAALALAASKSYEGMEQSHIHVLELKKRLLNGISLIDDCKINGPSLEDGSPYVSNISFYGLRSEVLLHALEEKNIFVSSGSACNSKKKSLSHVLEAMGLEKAAIDGAIRFSFCRFNTVEEVEYCIEVLKNLVPLLRRYQKKR